MIIESRYYYWTITSLLTSKWNEHIAMKKEADTTIITIITRRKRSYSFSFNCGWCQKPMKILLPPAIDPVDLVGICDRFTIIDRIAKFVGFALLKQRRRATWWQLAACCSCAFQLAVGSRGVYVTQSACSCQSREFSSATVQQLSQLTLNRQLWTVKQV